MRKLVRRALQRLVRTLAPYAGLGVFALPEFEWSEDPDDITFLMEEIETPAEWLTVTLH